MEQPEIQAGVCDERPAKHHQAAAARSDHHGTGAGSARRREEGGNEQPNGYRHRTDGNGHPGPERDLDAQHPLQEPGSPRARAFLTLVEKMAAEAFLIALEAFLAFSNNSAAAAMAAFPALSQAAGRALVASAAALLALSKKSEAALPAERHVAETVVATSIAAAMVALPAVWHVAEKAALAAAPMCAANSHARTPIPRHLGAITPVCYTFVLDRI
ncbi:hypothetical protein OsJ_11260 [Oryza sativa Japonica Group]|uniref:Uncharacterized protein n=1 Tax=Oryza sativa subsp. japonica TaxID=39947 RepID=A3AJ31_ORYSJ|nr:hypothetical protein OsJ_11260 [Oryza sativa Japonica Group]